MADWILGALIAAGLFVGMVLLLEVGRRMRQRRSAREQGTGKPSFGAVEGAVFAVLGLLVAFTFAGAASRFNERRQLVVQEANAIGTAYLRMELLPPEPRAAVREKFRQYVDARLVLYASTRDRPPAEAELARSSSLQAEIWSYALEQARLVSGPQATTMLLPALNEVFDIGATHVAMRQIHPPNIIMILLVGLALACSLFAGFGMADGMRSWLHILGFAARIIASSSIRSGSYSSRAT